MRRRPGLLRGILLAGAAVMLLAGPAVAEADGPRAGVAPAGGQAADPDEGAGGPVTLSSPLEERLFSALACMCPTCPKIPLASCQCGFAGKERGAIREKIAAGWTEERIRAWYRDARGPEVGRAPFGEAAFTIPPDSLVSRISYLLPYGLGALVLVVLVLAGRAWTRRGRARVDQQRGEGAPAPGGDAARDPYEDLLDRELKKLD